MPRPLRVAIVSDFAEEHWPSMDLVSDMLVYHLNLDPRGGIEAVQLRPEMTRRFSRLPVARGHHSLWNADRLLNRFWDYPRWMRCHALDFDVFHIVDHSYSQLVHVLPGRRTVVTCHDLDTFRCLLDPQREPRSAFFRAMCERTLRGLQCAARTACVSETTRNELMEHVRLVPESVVVVPNGVHPDFSHRPDELSDQEAAQLLGEPHPGVREIVHVGSTVARKRIDVLLRTFAAIRAADPGARLLRVGGPFTAEQETLARELGIAKHISVLPQLPTKVLASVYRRAALVLQPSEREGFGLPVVESMACGAVVVASDIPSLREVAGQAGVFCPVAQIEAWAATALALMNEHAEKAPLWGVRRARSLANARRFSWESNAARMSAIYEELAQ